MKSKKTTASGMEQNAIRVSQGAYQKAILKSVLVNLMLAVLALVLIYLCFAATVARVVPSSSGFVPVKNNTYAGGVLPPKTQALIALGEEKVGDGIGDRLKQSFLPQKPSAIVSIAAGPVAQEVKWTGGILTVDGKAMPAPLGQDPGLEFLSGQYVAVCVKGDCTPGTLLFFTPEQVLGVPFTQDLPVPPAPDLNTQGQKLDRNNAEQVTRASVIEGYYNNSDLACSLYTKQFLKNNGGVKQCKTDIRLLNTSLGRDFDFTANFLTKVKSDDGTNASVTYTLTSGGVQLTPMTVNLVKTDKGWAIDSVIES